MDSKLIGCHWFRLSGWQVEVDIGRIVPSEFQPSSRAKYGSLAMSFSTVKSHVSIQSTFYDVAIRERRSRINQEALER